VKGVLKVEKEGKTGAISLSKRSEKLEGRRGLGKTENKESLGKGKGGNIVTGGNASWANSGLKPSVQLGEKDREGERKVESKTTGEGKAEDGSSSLTRNRGFFSHLESPITTKKKETRGILKKKKAGGSRRRRHPAVER